VKIFGRRASANRDGRIAGAMKKQHRKKIAPHGHQATKDGGGGYQLARDGMGKRHVEAGGAERAE